MARMLVRDVMTVGVVTVSPETSLKEVAGLLLGAKVSGVPVVDGGRVVGIVSESDLLPLREGTAGHPVARASDVMTRKLISLVEEMSVTEAARVLQRHRIKRAPVMRGGRLVGIVTRGDLLRPYLRTDTEILVDVEESVLVRGMQLSPREVRVSVTDGVVSLKGEVPDPRTRSILLRLVRSIDGVVDVVDRLKGLSADRSVA
ncbi:MAG TPA: CBS domain-containing protein [Actinomycetota bacterium]